jgi:hypothetical protein
MLDYLVCFPVSLVNDQLISDWDNLLATDTPL